eukprot:m.18406 g.18406  ORF g.18406 m.18406 type:complete len:73 (+) comp27655_c0_seq1:94-312(+)
MADLILITSPSQFTFGCCSAVSRPTPPPRPAPRSRNAHQRQQGSNDPLPTAAAGNNNASLNSPPKDITTKYS